MLSRWFSLVTVGVSLLGCHGVKERGEEARFRMPANSSIPGVYDDFSNKGYIEATSYRKMQEGKVLPAEQVARELAGREIWYKSAPNSRFHTYIFGQRVNAPIDWYRVLRGDQRGKRFNTWGMINDPDCCAPGDDCDSKGVKFHGRSVTSKDTFGFDYCPGDEELLSYVGQPNADYAKVDPACTNPSVKAADALKQGLVENSCELAFGTSTGAVGFRKFPNPRFNAARWNRLGGWAGYKNREFEGSVEPPFRVAIACASCHVSFEPTRPPADPNKPQWFNISGTVGNQYVRISQILGSGTHPNSLEWQLFIPNSRPGITDTSAVPNDMIGNPGTINAIINLVQRPVFKESIARWRPVSSCDSKDASCQSVTYSGGGQKFWQWSSKVDTTFHVLKGGEDSVQPDLAVQRVYVNIGMCAEQCWMNHHTDLRALSPHDRGFKQTPFDIAQCRRDCAPFRANEDRVGDIVSFLLSARPTDLKDALKNSGQIQGASDDELKAGFTDYIEKRFGGSIEHGRQLFAQNCATCHSSQNSNKADDFTLAQDDFSGTDFLREITLDSGEVVRADWMGNDRSTSVELVGTYKCRALHTNHKAGHLWAQFASETYRNKPGTVHDAKGNLITGGPGYYRNISLLNAWAYAPFLHNNAIGPELCGRPDGENDSLHYNTYVGQQLGANQHKCDLRYDPSVEGRLQVFEKSVDQLLMPPARRPAKQAVASESVLIPLGLNFKSIGKGAAQKYYLEFPAGTPIAVVGNLDYKALIADILGSLPYMDKDPDYQKYWTQRAGASCGPRMAQAVRGTMALLAQAKDIQGVANTEDVIHNSIRDGNNQRLKVYEECYSTCAAVNEKGQTLYENSGHSFMTDASPEDKNALKAFLATL